MLFFPPLSPFPLILISVSCIRDPTLNQTRAHRRQGVAMATREAGRREAENREKKKRREGVKRKKKQKSVSDGEAEKCLRRKEEKDEQREGVISEDPIADRVSQSLPPFPHTSIHNVPFGSFLLINSLTLSGPA